ncbi:MAG: thioredoxin [Patescibacteria group bacterium]|nr:thioredoxin [Patescibacteria group bacterium]
MTLNLTDENFEKEIENADKPVLVDYYTFWCSRCTILSPILEKLAEEYKDKFIFAKINLETAPFTAQKYGIERIPTVILFKNGFQISGFIGVRSEPEIKEWLEKNQEIIDKLMEKVNEIIKNYEDYAQKNGWKLNPDRKLVERLVMGMLANEKKYGARYCVCRRITGNSEEDKKIICPCVYVQQEIKEQGHCFCGLFFEK